MASTDAKPVPLKNVAYRVTFPLLDSDGDLVTGAAGLDTEISKDGGTFADCTNEATEIATASGMYFLDLTSTEMNADCVALIVKTSTVGAKTVPIVLYPEEEGDIRVNATAWGGTAVASANVLIDGAITAAKIATDAITAAKIASGALTAAKFAAGAFDAVWTVAARLLTAGTNIVLAKGTGVTGFNDLDAAGVRGAVGLATANLDTQLAALPTAGENADAVWDEAIAGHVAAGSTGEALTAAGSAGDPWVTALPGAYGAGSAGFIVGNNLNATVSSRASQTSVDDIPTNAELATALDPLPTAAEIADAVWDESTTGHATAGTFGEQLKTDVDAILADTNELQSDWVNGGRLDLILDARASQTSVDDLPTNAELATSQAAADDATLAAIAALNNPTVAAIADAVWDELMSGHLISGSAGEFQANTPTSAQIVAGLLAAEITELISVPGMSPQLEEAIAFLYMAVRNRRDTTATADEIHNSGGSVIATATVSDDGTTFSKGKYA